MRKTVIKTNATICYLCIILLGNLLLPQLLVSNAYAQTFSQKLEVQLRADDRSSRDIRYQYRVRYRPQYSFNDTWSINAFAVTGDDYSSSHNTLDDDSADYFYLRRLFLRHEDDYGKTEFGTIPTYKGRVSSTGLSKDGWIKGFRHVRAIGEDNLEIVLGQLDSLDASTAMSLPDEIDYVEVEYSAKLNQQWSYELSAEHIAEVNYIRTELRYKYTKEYTMFAELVSRIDTSEIKTVIGGEGEITINNGLFEYFVHYSYVSDDFGLRAELIEDFLGTGHGISAEIGAQIGNSQFDWFMRYDAVEGSTRAIAGLKWSL